jgi:hypothetical protein
MSKVSSNVVRIETWNVRNDGSKVEKSPIHGEKRPIRKVATRNHLGQFHGATNFRGTINPR